MFKFIGGIAAALLVVACSAGTGGAGTTGPGGTTNPLGSGPVGSAVSDAKAQLCDPTNQASLGSLSTKLATVDANTDTSQLQTALGTAQSNLQALQVGAAQTTLKDAALSALQSVQAGLDNPSTVADTAASAANALTALDSALC